MNRTYDLDRLLPRKGGRALFAAVLALVIALALASLFTTVPPGHNQVATLFGEVQPVPYGEGMHIVNPLLDFESFDLRAQTHTWQEVHVPSQDKLKTSMDLSVTFRIEPSHTPRILQETGALDDVIEKHVTPKVRSLLREAGKSVAQSQDFYLETVQQELQSYMEAGLTEYLQPKGVHVDAVLFRDITLPPVVQNAVVQTKERQEQLEREKAQLRIVEQQAQQEVVQAQAREQAAIADANARRTQADAEAYRILKEAEARARANVAIAESVTPELVHYNRIERWNGAYPQTLLSSDAGGVLLSLPAHPK
jgi:regulator of protease activity HflC (stomatin/prohibitin superfamily)